MLNKFSLLSGDDGKGWPAHVVNFNPRAENNGPKDTKLAGDLKLRIKASNESILSELSPTLLHALYTKSDGTEGQGELIEPLSALPKLKHPLMSPFGYDLDLHDYTLLIDLGLGGPKSNLEIGECAVNQFSVECQEGGTVVLEFRIQLHPSEKEAGKLAALIKHDVEITLTPPEERQEALDGTK